MTLTAIPNMFKTIDMPGNRTREKSGSRYDTVDEDSLISNECLGSN